MTELQTRGRKRVTACIAEPSQGKAMQGGETGHPNVPIKPSDDYRRSIRLLAEIIVDTACPELTRMVRRS
jgi:hypothetical protein